MSQTKHVSFGDRFLWASDVSLAVLLAETVRVAEERSANGQAEGDAGMLEAMRLAAAVRDYGLSIENWPADRLEWFIELLEDAGQRLDRRGRVTAREAAEWRVLGEETVLWRGDDEAETAPIVALAEAVVSLIRGTLAEPPEGKHWVYGFGPEPSLA